MKTKLVNSFELNTLNKFSKFILEFNNTIEFKDYIKKNKFKIAGCILKEDSKLLRYHQIEPLKWENVERSIQKRWLIPEKDKRTKCTAKLFEGKPLKFHTIEVLPYFYYIAFYLFNNDRIIGLFPLNALVRRLDNWKHFKAEVLLEDMKKDGRFYIYWNKEFMQYEEGARNIETINIGRKYVGLKKHSLTEETKILVIGEDDKKRDITDEAIFYFNKRGFNAVKTKTFEEVIRNEKWVQHNFLEDNKIRKVLSKEDLKKIKSRDDSYAQIYQLDMTGYPDLFVWNDNNDYFFVEVKSERDKLHRSQFEWIKWNEKVGKFKFKILKIITKK